MAYLFINRGFKGREFISDIKPFRAGHRKGDDFNCYFRQNDDGSVSGRDLAVYDRSQDISGTKDDLSFWSCGDYDPEPVELPSGMIKKMTGLDITFWDEPIEIKTDGDDIEKYDVIPGKWYDTEKEKPYHFNELVINDLSRDSHIHKTERLLVSDVDGEMWFTCMRPAGGSGAWIWDMIPGGAHEPVIWMVVPERP